MVGLVGGTYLLTVVDQNGCYGDSAAAINIQINEPAELEISFTFSDYNGYNVSCYGEDNGTVIAIPTGGTPPLVATFAVSGTGTPADPNALEAGTYSYTVMDGNGCMTDSSFVISEPSAPLTISSSSTPEWCDPILSGTATVNPSGGTPGYTYDWLSNPTINSPTLNGLSGVY